MARTTTLTQAELQTLRDEIQTKFSSRKPSKAPIKAVTYREAYEDLREDILSVTKVNIASVSLGRLRKLFYYTNPQACSIEKLQKPSFGKDFIEVLEKYVADCNSSLNHQPEDTNLKKVNWLTRLIKIMIIGFGLVSSTFAIFHFSKTSKIIEENFDAKASAMIEYLENPENNKWLFLDKDEYFLKQQQKDGALTLYTLQGDYWTKEKENKTIPNLPIKKINCDCCTITIKLFGFYPYQNWQQAGVILFADESSLKDNHLRVTYGYSKGKRPFPCPRLGSKETAFQKEKIDVFPMSKGEVSSPIEHILRCPDLEFQPERLDTVYMRIKITKNDCSFQFKRQDDWRQYYDIPKRTKISFTPNYLGLVAMQGLSDEDGNPLCADILPIYIGSVLVEPCNN